MTRQILFVTQYSYNIGVPKEKEFCLSWTFTSNTAIRTFQYTRMSLCRPKNIYRHPESEDWFGSSSRAIAIQRSPQSMPSDIDEETEALFSAERHYNAATWRMYRRINNYRRKQATPNRNTFKAPRADESESDTPAKPRAIRVHLIDDSAEEIFSMDLWRRHPIMRACHLEESWTCLQY